MKPHHLPPASIYYFKARLRPLGNPVFWVSVMVLSSVTFFFWEIWSNPERLSPVTQPASNSETLNVDASSSADPNAVPATEGQTAQRSAEEQAIAEIEQLEALSRQVAPVSIDVSSRQQNSSATATDNSSAKLPAPKIGEIPELSTSTVSSQTNSYGIYIPKNPFDNPETKNLLFPSTDQSFYNPEINLNSPDGTAIADQQLHPLQSAIERHANDEIPFTPAVPRSRSQSEQLRPNASGILSSSELRPNAGDIISTPELRPSASDLTEVVPRQAGLSVNSSPTTTRYNPPPTNSYDYLVQSAPGSGVAPPVIPSNSPNAPVYDLRQRPPQMRNTTPENFNNFNYQGLQPARVAPSPFSENNRPQENIFEGYSRFDSFSNPYRENR